MNQESRKNCGGNHSNNIFQGGFQKYFPKNEAQIYQAKFTLDVANYCIENFENETLSNQEINCAKRLVQMNNKFINM